MTAQPPEQQLDVAQQLPLTIDHISRMLRTSGSVDSGGLPAARASVLLAATEDGSVRLSRIARQQRLHPTMLSRIVGHLVAAGLVLRTHDPEDRRSALLEPTERGRELAARIQAQRAEKMSAALAQMSPQHREAIEAAMPALEALLEALHVTAR